MAPKSKSAAVKKTIDKKVGNKVGKKLVEEKTEKKTPPVKKVTKKAAPAQKVTMKAATAKSASPAKKAVAKTERTRVEPEKKALSKKTKKPLVSQIDFASVLLDTCQTLIMCMNSEWEEVADKKTGTYKVVRIHKLFFFVYMTIVYILFMKVITRSIYIILHISPFSEYQDGALPLLCIFPTFNDDILAENSCTHNLGIN